MHLWPSIWMPVFDCVAEQVINDTIEVWFDRTDVLHDRKIGRYFCVCNGDLMSEIFNNEGDLSFEVYECNYGVTVFLEVQNGIEVFDDVVQLTGAAYNFWINLLTIAF